MEEIQSYTDQIRKTYRQSLDVVLPFSNHENVVYCDDEEFETFLKGEHSLKDLQACIYLLERHIDLQQEIIHSLFCLQELHKHDQLSAEYNGVLGKMLSAQSKLATLRSRTVRCLTKQIQRRYKDPLIQLPAWSTNDVEKRTRTRYELRNKLYAVNSDYNAFEQRIMESDYESPAVTTGKQDSIDFSRTGTTGEGEAMQNELDNESKVEVCGNFGTKTHINNEKSNTTDGLVGSAFQKESGDLYTEEDGSFGQAVYPKKRDERSNENVGGESLSNTSVNSDSTEKARVEGVYALVMLGNVSNKENFVDGVKKDKYVVDGGHLKLGKVSPTVPPTELVGFNVYPEVLATDQEISQRSNENAGGESFKNTSVNSDLTENARVEGVYELVMLGNASNKENVVDGVIKDKYVVDGGLKGNVSPSVSPTELVGFNVSREVLGTDQKISQTTSNATIWDPSLLIRDIFGHTKEIKPKQVDDRAYSQEIQMAGYLEKLPMNRKKATIVKTWRKRYFKVMNGKLFYFEDHRATTPISFIKLAQCSVKELGNKCLEVIEAPDHGGKLMVMRCATLPELQDWKKALEHQGKLKENRPAFELPHEQKTIIIIDFGSSCIKAGFLDDEAWPQVLIPSVYAINKEDSKKIFYGYEALAPYVRERSKLVYPLRAAITVGKSVLNPNELIGFIDVIFKQLKAEPIHHQVIATLPVNLREQDKNRLVEIFLGHFQVDSIYMSPQAILSMYSYSATSGVVVNIGNNIEIVPIEDGYVVESGVIALPYGGRQVTDYFARMLSSSGYRYFSEIENYIAEYLKVKTCYISQDFEKEKSEDLSLEVDMSKYDLPNDHRWVKVGKERLTAFEGLFKPTLYGKDTPGLHQLVYQAVMACSIDSRKHMCRNIYLSGGTTKVQGFAERLQTELSTKCFPSMPIKVHAAPDRQFAAFVGASVLASLHTFQDLCITSEEWEELGPDILKKWDHF